MNPAARRWAACTWAAPWRRMCSRSARDCSSSALLNGVMPSVEAAHWVTGHIWRRLAYDWMYLVRPGGAKEAATPLSARRPTTFGR